MSDGIMNPRVPSLARSAKADHVVCFFHVLISKVVQVAAHRNTLHEKVALLASDVTEELC